MADKLFPMYCGLDAIQGMHAEKAFGMELLRHASSSEKAIALLPINDDVTWVYGQCNFVQDPDHISNFKFSNTRDALRDQRVLPSLIEGMDVDVVFFVDALQYEWFKSDAVHRRYASFFTLLQKNGLGGYSRV